MVIFHSYVSLPEGIPYIYIWSLSAMIRVFIHSWEYLSNSMWTPGTFDGFDSHAGRNGGIGVGVGCCWANVIAPGYGKHRYGKWRFTWSIWKYPFMQDIVNSYNILHKTMYSSHISIVNSSIVTVYKPT